MATEDLKEDTPLEIIDKIYANASDIRSDWSDPRTECRDIWRLCEKLKEVLQLGRT